MKIRTWRYMIREGFVNTYRNKLMSLASVSIVGASLVIFGIFMLISMNLNYNVNKITSQPELEVFLLPEMNEQQIKVVESSIKSNDKISSVKIVTKNENLEKAKKIMGEGAKLLEGEDASFMNHSFIIRVKDINQYEEVAQQYKKMPQVENVRYYIKEIKFISKISYWITLVNSVILIVLLIISVMIISNTIKLTVFARRKEISIMKYIGSTDWFIRWPFIIEGILIGMFGALLSFIIVGYGYRAIEERFNTDLLTIGSDTIKLIKMSSIGIDIIGVYILFGIFVGAVGSSVSIHKYLKV